MANVKISDIATTESALASVAYIEGERTSGNTPVKIPMSLLSVASGIGPAWTALTFSSTSSVGGVTAYASTETFTGAAANQIELEALIATSKTAGGCLGIAAGSTSYRIAPQDDGNIVVYRYNAGDSALGSSGASTTNDYNGFWYLKIYMNISAASDNFFAMEANGYRFPSTNHYNNTANNLVGTITPFIQTSDISKCYARARLIG